MFLEISQNSQENTCARVSFLVTFIKKETLAQFYSCDFCKISKNTFFTKHLRTTASYKNLNLVQYLIFTELTFIAVIFMSFMSFSVLFHFFLSLLIKSILLSWELIKMFLTPLTSLKYVHASKWWVLEEKKFILVNRVIESHYKLIKTK